MESQRDLGSLIRLHPLSLNDVPILPDSASRTATPKKDDEILSPTSTTTHPALQPFLKAILEEASKFMDSFFPANFKHVAYKNAESYKVEVKKFSINPEELLQRVDWEAYGVPRKGIDNTGGRPPPGENWFSRESVHTDADATMQQFHDLLRNNHSQHEKDYTPNVFDARVIVSWEKEIARVDIEAFSGIQMMVVEMAHQMPFPLKPRVFPVLLVSAVKVDPQKPENKDEFLVIQVPIDLSSLPQAIYSARRNESISSKGLDEQQRKPVVLAKYVSIERVKNSEDGQKRTWQMAMASDAAGSLPMGIQKIAMPGKIIEDVPLFMNYVRRQNAT